jgi:hypothetical protein
LSGPGNVADLERRRAGMQRDVGSEDEPDIAVSILSLFMMCPVSTEVAGLTISFTKSLTVSLYEWLHILQCFYILDPQLWYFAPRKWVIEDTNLRVPVLE